MEEGRLIPPRERKPQSRPKSSPSDARDTSPAIVGVRRPATASRASGTSDLHSIIRNHQNGAGASLQPRDEISQEQADRKESHEPGGKLEALVDDDGVGTSKVDEGWTLGNVADSDDNAGMAEYSSSFTHMNEQIPHESPPKYSVNYSSIRHLLELTEGETDLDSDKEIPDIFSQVDQLQRYSDISGYKDSVLGSEVKPYLDEFGGTAQQEQLMVGKMTLEQVEAEEQRLQTEYLAFHEQEAMKQRERQTQIAKSQKQAKREVQKTLRKRRKALLKKEAQMVQSSMTEKKRVYSAYKKAEQHMIMALKARKSEIKALYGDLERAHGYYGAVKGRRWKVDWTKAPQPVQIKIKSLRGIRDKLPASRYLLLVSLHDRLGGHVLRWSKLKGQEWGAATMPVQHKGNFYDTEIKFDQSIYTVLPSKPSVSPSMVLVFELFILRGQATPTDQVVGWGIFPISDANFNVIEGKYKCPFLRGCVDPLITKHSKVEALLTSNLENWLSNLYFEVIKLPRYLQGMHEYEVELQFTSSLLGQPDRTHDEADVIDGSEPVRAPVIDAVDGGGLFSSTGDMQPLLSASSSNSENVSTGRELDSVQLNTATLEHPSSVDVTRAGLSSRLSRRFHSGYAGDSESNSSSDEEEFDRDGGRAHDEEGFLAIEGKPGLFYKVHEFNPFAEQQREVQTLLPHSSVLEENAMKNGWARKRKMKNLSYEKQLDQHTISVHPPFSNSGRVKRKINERLQYLGRQFLSEMGLSQWKSLDFWSMVVIFILCWWIRLYLHYVAQYGFLRISNIPVIRFDFFPHTVILHYQSSLLFTREEVAIVLLGPFFNTFVFCLLILFSWGFQNVFGSLPDLGSLFIAAFGVQVILDPYWILIVDLALLRFNPPQPDLPTADITKLYWHFVRLEGNGVMGIFLAIFLYVFTTFVTLACFYMYFLRVHMNGKLIDIYHRLKSPEEKFFVPNDLEISNEELGYICRKAERWRGTEGERRKVAVHDYVWGEEEREERERQESVEKETQSMQRRRDRKPEVTTHISIHTLHLDGLRELYRHFLRLDNGAIIEIFGDFSSVSGISPMINNSYDIHHSLVSFGHSETSFEGRAGGSSLSRIDQSIPSLKISAGQDALEDQQDSISVNHKGARLNSSATKSSEINHSNSSLKVPVRDITSPNYNSRRHTEGTDYQSISTSSVTEAKASIVTVSLSIPDHSEETPSDEPPDLSHFKKQREGDGYFMPKESEMDGNLTTEEKLTSSFHNDEQQHLLDDAEGSQYNKFETGKLKSTKMRYHEKLLFEKKLSAGQLV